MPLKASERPKAGFKHEDSTAKSLKRKGKSVKQMPRNARYDLECGGQKLEVKSAIKTSYKGSDGHPVTGHVFSNMKKNPKSDKHILKCLSPDRKKVLKTYEIPSKHIKQRTLTITDNGKYEKFKKTANKRRARHLRRKLKYETAGSFMGAAAAVGPKRLIDGGKMLLGLDYHEENVNFGTVVRAAIGSAIGRNLGSTLAEKTRRKHEHSRRSTQGIGRAGLHPQGSRHNHPGGLRHNRRGHQGW